MLFTSEPYLLFLPIVVGLNWALPARYRPVFLVGASYYFYASWNPPYLLLIFLLTIGNYVLGLLQDRSTERRKSILVAALVLDVAALGVFKYLGWLDESTVSIARALGFNLSLPLVKLILPLGLSFFTFEFIHYQVDLYRGGRAIRDPIRFALFPAFFPTQIAGPIKRYADFDDQVRERPRFDAALFLEGLELIAIGMFKKVVLADNLARVAALVFANTAGATAGDAWIAAIAFYGRAYFDFSGYTDIARGSAQLFGYRIPLNFRAPMLATSVQDFWQRWHMSLTFWLRDYIFFPLAQTRFAKSLGGRGLLIFAVMVTGLVCGVWHGAGAQFALFGLIMGATLVFGRVMTVNVWRRLPPTVAKVGGWIQTQGMVASFIGLFALQVPQAVSLWSRQLAGGFGFRLLHPVEVIGVLAVIALTLAIQLALPKWKPRDLVSRFDVAIALRPAYVMSVATVALYAAVVNAAFGVATQRFIYFQF